MNRSIRDFGYFRLAILSKKSSANGVGCSKNSETRTVGNSSSCNKQKEKSWLYILTVLFWLFSTTVYMKKVFCFFSFDQNSWYQINTSIYRTYSSSVLFQFFFLICTLIVKEHTYVNSNYHITGIFCYLFFLHFASTCICI